MKCFRTFGVVSVLLVLLVATGCTPKKTVKVDPMQDSVTMGLDYQDFAGAADSMINDMLTSGAVDRPGGGRYVLAISRVTNDTMQRIDTDQLTKKIRVALLRSGKVVTTTAIGLGGPEDPMAAEVRKLRKSKEVNQGTVAAKGQIVAPDLSLSGKIIQRNYRVDSETQQVDYYFMLSLTDVNTGLAIWESEKPISKQGTSRSVSW
ncbi:penicillin-binding protein activator LpoB [Oceanidesulfovibrio indonesiensis]|uniref:Penicillin-binding protein activator LpoB n=1 Tax=Oceanidesulfovibrio indonesiensis TaxID=54767 RepID=A0A7M3MAX8_9BACT|nr:penicillin-binding protein activator LpoB [Oceanidesulfovibrio indonesiensis]TVM14499.1 penicillin-binding protein activator LpoB [Oceanidesulfovibrio indonesiensis]